MISAFWLIGKGNPGNSKSEDSLAFSWMDQSYKLGKCLYLFHSQMFKIHIPAFNMDWILNAFYFESYQYSFANKYDVNTWTCAVLLIVFRSVKSVQRVLSNDLRKILKKS